MAAGAASGGSGMWVRMRKDSNKICPPEAPGLMRHLFCARISFLCCGGCSSVGRVPDCDSGCRGFESHQPPHPNSFENRHLGASRVLFLGRMVAISRFGGKAFAQNAGCRPDPDRVRKANWPPQRRGLDERPRRRWPGLRERAVDQRIRPALSVERPVRWKPSSSWKPLAWASVSPGGAARVHLLCVMPVKNSCTMPY